MIKDYVSVSRLTNQLTSSSGRQTAKNFCWKNIVQMHTCMMWRCYFVEQTAFRPVLMLFAYSATCNYNLFYAWAFYTNI